MSKIRICIFCLLVFQMMQSQNPADSLALQFNLRFGNLPLEPGKKYISTNDTLSVETFKCYISGIEIRFKDNSIFKEANSYHLLDMEDSNSLIVKLKPGFNKEISAIAFNIGVDSLASVSGALSGDLDPAKGMYWAWQSGYINMKMEGKSSSCKTRKNEFQLHIGGYKKPNYTMQKVSLIVKHKPEIIVDLAELFSQISLSKTNSVMIPGAAAMQIAAYSILMFKTE